MIGQYKQKYRIIIAAILVASLLVGGGTYYYYSTHAQPIVPYDEARDMDDIIALFKDEKYWLVNDPNYSMQYTLKHRTPHENPLFWNTMDIVVLRDHGKFAGFATYYMTKKDEGRLLFLAISQESRCKGCGKKLIQYAVNELEKKGARSVYLAVRVDNVKAQSLYGSLGFKEYLRENTGFLFMRKYL